MSATALALLLCGLAFVGLGVYAVSTNVQAVASLLAAQNRHYGVGVRRVTAPPPAVFGWAWDGEGEDVDPPEPGKVWITVGPLDADGHVEDEVAIIVLRLGGLTRDGEIVARAVRERAAQLIVDSLNANPDARETYAPVV